MYVCIRVYTCPHIHTSIHIYIKLVDVMDGIKAPSLRILCLAVSALGCGTRTLTAAGDLCRGV